jgi:hypothetical protein
VRIGLAICMALLLGGVAQAQEADAPLSPTLELYQTAYSNLNTGMWCYPVGYEGKKLQSKHANLQARLDAIREKLVSIESEQTIQALEGDLLDRAHRVYYTSCPTQRYQSLVRSRAVAAMKSLERLLGQHRAGKIK